MHRAVVLSFWAVLSTAAICEDAVKPLGSVAKLDDLLATVKQTKAKVILLNFWGITCSPCKAEMPLLTRASEKFKGDSNVAFIGLCISEESLSKEKLAEGAAEIIHQRKVTYSNLVWSGAGEALLEKFDIQGTPYTILISPEGKLLDEIKIPLDPDKAVELIVSSIAKALEAGGTATVKK